MDTPFLANGSPSRTQRRFLGCSISDQAANVITVLLLVLAAACSVIAVCGVGQGWAYYHESDYKIPKSPVSPPIDLNVWVGWWRSSSTLSVSEYLPTLKFEQDAAQVFGGVTAGILITSTVFALVALGAVAAAATGTASATRMTQRFLWPLASFFTLAVLIATIGLYIALAIGMRHQTLEQLGEKMTPRPGWAWGAAMVAGTAWSLVALMAQGSGSDAYSRV